MHLHRCAHGAGCHHRPRVLGRNAFGWKPLSFPASGGTPELVGADAGVGISAPLDWDEDHPPEPERLADAVLQLADHLPERSAAARERSLRFDARVWIERHHTVFTALVRRGSPVS